MRKQNFNCAPKFFQSGGFQLQVLHFKKKNFQTRRRFSDHFSTTQNSCPFPGPRPWPRRRCSRR